MELGSALFASLTSPMVLAFLLGILATLLRSDLKFPEGMYMGLTIYLLFAIGLKGGVKLSDVAFADFYKPLLAAIAACLIIAAVSFVILTKLGKFDNANAAAIAAHFGSVSAVTFSEGLAFLELMSISFEGFMPAILAIMEVPAILLSIWLARRHAPQSQQGMGKVLHELFTNKGTILLLGGLGIGLITQKEGFEQVAPMYDGLFRGVLCLFLLEVGLVAGRRLFELKKVGFFLLGYGLVMPVLHATMGVFMAQWAGLSMGGATLFGLLCASASYIAAPAAVRIAIPEANPTLYLTGSLAIAFPFNVTIGLPLYLYIAQIIYA
ncbi:MAG: sodium-dependent bicarbonate transport family permease [Sphingobacteriaceae bacterium]|nr:sodium-dependent bicarbonate transport family permease [Sphingobacteriaceae bacterium]